MWFTSLERQTVVIKSNPVPRAIDQYALSVFRFRHFHSFLFTRSYFVVRQLFRSLNIQLTHARYLNISFHEREVVEPVKKPPLTLIIGLKLNLKCTFSLTIDSFFYR